jgi:UDP-GlcNAc:undecaprenyl-phosphate/decaprenyl-phosphate GlcNAc-1-phosphate transferase
MYFENPSVLNPYILACVAIIAFGVAWFLTPRIRDYAIRVGWLDMPAARRVHKTPKPRIGGVGIFAGFSSAILAALIFGLFVQNFWRPADVWRIGLLLLGSLIICAVMFVDDIRGLEPLPKLLWQFGVAALIVVPQLFASEQEPLGVLIETVVGLPLWWLAVPFTLFWIVAMMNTVNLTDGLDGLAGGVVCIGALILWLETLFQDRGGFQFTSSLLALALACSILGFLVFNWHPSSIIMGDSGAMFIGYALAVISIIDGAKVAIALLIIGFPAMDVAYVIIYRLRQGRAPWRAGRDHFHHRLLDMGWSVRQIVLLFYAISLTFGIIGVLPFMQSTTLKFAGLIALVVCLVPLLLYSTRRRPVAPPEILPEKPLEPTPDETRL